MNDHAPGSVGEAFANIALNYDRLMRSVRRHTRYVAADMHRDQLVWSGRYTKTSNRGPSE